MFTATLWEPIFYPLPTATSSVSCGPITYRLNGLETPEPFEIETHDGQFGFWIRLTDTAMATDTPFSLDSCITIEGTDEVCKSQSGLVIKGKNPCPETQIFDLAVPDLVSVVQGNTDTSFQFTVWPPIDNVGYENSAEYGTDRCGMKSFMLKDESNVEIDWATILPDGTLKVQPGLSLPA